MTGIHAATLWCSIGTFRSPLLFSMIGKIWMIGLFVAAAITRGMLTIVMIPEMRGRPLEDINE
jgi:hypothetical protein